MTTQEIRERLAKILACSNDPEAAHALEDDLYCDYIKSIAEQNSDPMWEDSQEFKAMLVLTSQDIKFPRWCA